MWVYFLRLVSETLDLMRLFHHIVRFLQMKSGFGKVLIVLKI